MVRGPNGQVPIPGLAEGIRTARRHAGLSQADLAQELGIRQSSVGQWERGATTPTLAMFHQMVAVVGPWPRLEVLLPADQADTATAETAAQRAGPPDSRELARLVDQGLSDRQIGERYGVVSGTVRLWRYDAELLRYHPSKRPSPQTLARLVWCGHHRPRRWMGRVCRSCAVRARPSRTSPLSLATRPRRCPGVPRGQGHQPTGHATTWQRRSRFDRRG